MKILSVFGWPVRTGGHFKSALAHMKCLRQTGHDILVIAPEAEKSMLQQFADADVRVRMLQDSPRVGRFPSTRGASEIMQIAKQQVTDVIHAQDFLGLAASYLAAIKLRLGFVFTRAGGPVNNNFPPRKANSIFYSHELLDGMLQRHHLKRNNITVIRARIDMSVYKPIDVSPSFIQKYNLPESEKKIVMAIRLAQPKKPWLDNLLRFANQMSRQDLSTSIVIAGDGPLRKQLTEQVSAINSRFTKPRVYLLGPILEMKEITQLCNYADIVVGHGRGIMEAMACGRPVAILGENGQAQIVEPENVEDIAYYNFSGRHFRYRSQNTDNLPTVLKELTADDKRLATAGSFSLKYIKEHLDAQIGAKEVAHVYDCSVHQKHSYIDYLRWYSEIVKALVRDGLKRRLGSVVPLCR